MTSEQHGFWDIAMETFPFIIPAIAIGFAGTYMLFSDMSAMALVLTGLFWFSLYFVYLGCTKLKDLGDL